MDQYIEKNYVFYFCYGSNMSANRIKTSAPSAVRITNGKIKNYRLDFGNYFSKNWNGHVATIVPDRNKIVWGSIWKIPINEIINLDYQEAVYQNVYNNIFVPVIINTGIVYCYTYYLTDLPSRYNNNKPSKSYIDTIVQGAEESNLPYFYKKKLYDIQHNGLLSLTMYPHV